MLILTRRPGEEIVIRFADAAPLVIRVMIGEPGKVKLCCYGNRDVEVNRREIDDERYADDPAPTRDR